MTPRPAAAIAVPRAANGESFSRKSQTESAMVNSTWVWITSDARPGEMSAPMA